MLPGRAEPDGPVGKREREREPACPGGAGPERESDRTGGLTADGERVDTDSHQRARRERDGDDPSGAWIVVDEQ